MSSQAVLKPLKTPSITHHTSPIIVNSMILDDIPAVMAIERTSFPRPWPERAYRYELIENPNAYFVVARAHDIVESSMSGAYASQWQKLAQLLHLQRRQRRAALQQISNSHAQNKNRNEDLRAQGRLTHTPHARSTVVGFAGMWMYVDEAHIATIATHPGWRGRGIGELILLNLMREAQQRNAASVTLEVRVSNNVAQNLYRKYGFEEVGYRKAYYQDNREDALLMTVTHFTEAEYRARLDALERELSVKDS